MLALLLFPYAVFLFAGYSEPLFLAFATWAWWAVRQQRWALAAVLGCGASATRVVGIPFAVALAVEYVVVARRSGRRIGPEAGWFALPAVPVIAFLSYLRVRTGHWDSYSRAMHDGWHRDLAAPWTAVRATWHYATNVHQSSAFLWFWRAELLAVLVGIVLTVVLVRGRRWGEATYVAGTTLLMSSATYLASGVRAVLVWFPLYLVLGRGFQRSRWSQTAYVWLSADSRRSSSSRSPAASGWTDRTHRSAQSERSTTTGAWSDGPCPCGPRGRRRRRDRSASASLA